MSTTTTTNGRPQRKQLADQIDRLDTLLDGLNEAVADAVRDGTRLALKDALIEIMTDPTLRSKLQSAAAGAPAVPAPAKSGFFAWLKSKAVKVATGAKVAFGAVVEGVSAAAAATINAIRSPHRLLALAGKVKHLLVIGAGVGAAVSIVSFFAPHAVSAALSGIGGSVAAMALRASLWTRRTAAALTMA